MRQLVDGALFDIVEWRAKVLAGDQIGARLHVRQSRVLRWRAQGAIQGVFDLVVRHEVVLHAVHRHAHRLLDEAPLLEAVRVDERPDQGPFILAVFCADIRSHGRRGRQWGIATTGPRVRLPWLGHAFVPPVCLLLLARRKGLDEFAIDEKVAQDAARAPWNSVCPPLDAGSVLFVDEDAPALDELAPFAVVWSPWDMVKGAIQAGFKKDKRVASGGNVTEPRGLKRTTGHPTHSDSAQYHRQVVKPKSSISTHWFASFRELAAEWEGLEAFANQRSFSAARRTVEDQWVPSTTKVGNVREVEIPTPFWPRRWLARTFRPRAAGVARPSV